MSSTLDEIMRLAAATDAAGLNPDDAAKVIRALTSEGWLLLGPEEAKIWGAIKLQAMQDAFGVVVVNDV